MKNRLFIFVLAAAGVLAVSSLCIAEDAAATAVSQEPAEQWLWGEVTAVRPGDRLIAVKYIDPETDKEMNMSLAVDDKTKFENASSLDDIKPGNSVSFTYIPAAAGQNVAKSINLEKIENVSAPSETPVEAVPAGQQPTETPAPAVVEPAVTQEQPVASQNVTSNSVDNAK